MTLLESQNHVTAGCEQRRVSFTEQHHGVTSSHLSREGFRSLMPCLDAGFCSLHHREQQRESALVLTDPGLCNRSGHALGPLACSRKSDNLGLFDGGHRREGHQFRITRTNSNESEAGGHSGIKDGQRSAPSRIRSMSRLSIFPEPGERVGEETPVPQRICSDPDSIQRELRTRGVDFEQWPTCRRLRRGAEQEEILGAYADDIRRILAAEGFAAVDAIRVHPDHPERAALRRKFLAEHIHSEREVRFFVEGQGLFCLRIDGEVLVILCEQGDLIHVPAGTRHWFDMGSEPSFCALRFFNSSAGWVARFTGDPIADRYPRLN